MENRVALSVELAVAPEVAWRLITDNSDIARWWGDYVTLEAMPGGVLRETWSNGDREVITSGTVLVAVPPERLSMSWADDDWPASTTVTFTISALADGGSRLDLVHDGWEALPPATRSRLVADHAAGWSMHLRSLVAHAAGVDTR